MGFLDKAKKVAEQAQAKLDEVQTQFNQGQGGGQQSGGPAVEYDKHGRPVEPAPVTPDASAPPAPPAPPTPEAGAVPDPAAPTAPGAAPDAPPAMPGPAPTEDRNRPSTEPPKLSSGDPLAG